MQPAERNARFTNPLAKSTSPYLRQHAHNPVYWYPWGEEALARARAENKPILLSIGYSTCYWCHVMEREVFENLSIASLMNRAFINIKVDREEHPQLDEIYMVARQVMTRQGGWPNNVFLTPELQPFYAGGTFPAVEIDESRPSFPRILEWMNYLWTNEQDEVRMKAGQLTEAMRPYLVFESSPDAGRGDAAALSAEVYDALRQHHDERAGGFFQAPKFPHECYLSFLMAYHEQTGKAEAMNIVTRTLGRMAAGGLYDQVGCGFHRYAIDKDWLVPHFEKMLYNQAQTARLYTDAARLTGNPYFAEIARGVLEFSCGPLLDAGGGFYAALDAETDGVEGAYYAWTPEELENQLTDEERRFLVHFFALADIPAFPGHKHTEGAVLVARRPLDEAARAAGVPYAAMAAQTAQVMNKLLHARGQRQSPRLDNKIITAWNGLMIDALAHAGQVFGQRDYIEKARRAASFILEHMTDENGALRRLYTAGRAQLEATLEDYAYLARGLIALHRATSEETFREYAADLMRQAEELFSDEAGKGYYFTQSSENLLIRIRGVEDSAMPNASAVMLHNLIDLHLLTGEAQWRARAVTLRDFVLNGRVRVFIEMATFLQAALRLEEGAKSLESTRFIQSEKTGPAPDLEQAAEVSIALFPPDAGPGDSCELLVTLLLAEGWYVNAAQVNQPNLIPTQADVQGAGVRTVGVVFPEPLRRQRAGNETLLVYEGLVNITVRMHIAAGPPARPPLKLRLRFQPCRDGACHPPRDVVMTL